MEGFAIGWDENVSASAFEKAVLLPEGRYKGVLVDIQLGQHNPQQGGKIGACPKATATFKLEYEGNEVQLKDTFYMWSTILWKSAQLFAALGVPKNADGGIDNIPPTWARRQNDLIGRSCWINVKQDPFTGGDGQPHMKNKISSYTDKAPATNVTASASPAPRTAQKAAPAAGESKWNKW